MTSETRKHCWHPTGGGISMGFGDGSDDVRCCYCGMTASERWHTRTERIPRHGPYVSRSVRVSDGTPFDAEDCPASPEGTV